MERMRTENMNIVIKGLEQLFYKLDTNRTSRGLFVFKFMNIFIIVNYLVFKKMMIDNFGTDIEDSSLVEYFSDFIVKDQFNYQQFIQ